MSLKIYIAFCFLYLWGQWHKIALNQSLELNGIKVMLVALILFSL